MTLLPLFRSKILNRSRRHGSGQLLAVPAGVRQYHFYGLDFSQLEKR